MSSQTQPIASVISQLKDDTMHLSKRQKTASSSLKTEIDNLLQLTEKFIGEQNAATPGSNGTLFLQQQLPHFSSELNRVMQKIVSAHKDLLQQQQQQLGAHISAAAPPFIADQEAFYEDFIKSNGFDHSTIFDEDALKAVVMQHLIREGQFRVVEILEQEHGWTQENQSSAVGAASAASTDAEGDAVMQGTPAANASSSPSANSYKKVFKDMYDILDDMKSRRGVDRALAWSQSKEQDLRGHMNATDELESDLAALSIAAASTTSVKSKLQRLRSLQFTLHKLQFVELLRQASNESAPNEERAQAVRAAINYSRQHLSAFSDKHMEEIRYLMGSLMYAKRIGQSPYKSLLEHSHWEKAEAMFKEEFSQLEGQPSQSPLFVALTAGAQAIPTLLKLLQVTKSKFAQSVNVSAISQSTIQPNDGAGAADDEESEDEEDDLFLSTANRKQTSKSRPKRQVGQLGVQVDLDPSFVFHSTFTCPVSKEMCDEEQNPPMMLPCGHILAKNSISRMIRPTSQRFKCPYCPQEATMNACRKIKF